VLLNRWLRKLAPLVGFAVAVALVLVVVAPLARPSGRLELQRSGPPLDSAYYRARSARPRARIGGARTVKAWSLSLPLPQGWRTTNPTVRVKRSGTGVSVATSTDNTASQLASPPMTLAPGPYRIRIDGAVPFGGLQIGLARSNGSCLAREFFAAEVASSGRGEMVVPFRLERPTTLQIVFANWAPIEASSMWRLDRVSVEDTSELERQAAQRLLFTQQQTPLTRAPDPSALVLNRWSFESGLPGGWVAVAKVATRRTTQGLVVRTTRQKVAYQVVMTDPVQLRPDTYTAFVDGRILSGGMLLGVLDDDRNVWVVPQGHFWSGQHAGDSQRMAVRFALKKGASIRLILANWATTDRASTWLLRGASIVWG
jgi:hypothetical protein